MNEVEFKRHLRDMVHGHHHPDEHDWDPQPNASRKATRKSVKRPAAQKRKSRVSRGK
jgi:hypothetical protein